MNTPQFIQLDAIYKVRLHETASALKLALEKWKVDNPVYLDIVDFVLIRLQKIFDLAIADQINEPFDLQMGKIFGDELSHRKLSDPWFDMVVAARGPLSFEEFQKSFYRGKTVRQLWEKPEYVPSEETLKAINRELDSNQ